MEVKRKEPMSRHTTFRVGGPADWFVLPETREELLDVLSELKKAGTDYYVVGNGSNLLVSDQGFRGAVISMERFARMETEGTVLRAGAGALLSKIAGEARRTGLTGLEFAAGIPGTLGGAVVMNAGAYGSEIQDVIRSALLLDRDGNLKSFSREELELGYRTSAAAKNGCLILEAEFQLTEGEPEQIRRRMDELAAKRREKQPLEFPSAGSTFKRPAGNFAGKLIEEAGLKGFSVGGAQVSEKHAGFVINRNRASAADIYRLCREVQRRVMDHSGVLLELEVKLLGDFED